MAQITISYLSTYTNGVPTANATATVPVPTGVSADQHIQNIFRYGAFSFTDAAGLLTFVPASQVFKITSP